MGDGWGDGCVGGWVDGWVTVILTHAGRGHENPGDDHLCDGLLCSLCRLTQAGAVFVGDRNADFEFPAEQNACQVFTGAS